MACGQFMEQRKEHIARYKLQPHLGAFVSGRSRAALCDIHPVTNLTCQRRAGDIFAA